MSLTLKAERVLEEKKILNDRSGTILELGTWCSAQNAKKGY